MAETEETQAVEPKVEKQTANEDVITPTIEPEPTAKISEHEEKEIEVKDEEKEQNLKAEINEAKKDKNKEYEEKIKNTPTYKLDLEAKHLYDDSGGYFGRNKRGTSEERVIKYKILKAEIDKRFIPSDELAKRRKPIEEQKKEYEKRSKNIFRRITGRAGKDKQKADELDYQIKELNKEHGDLLRAHKELRNAYGSLIPDFDALDEQDKLEIRKQSKKALKEFQEDPDKFFKEHEEYKVENTEHSGKDLKQFSGDLGRFYKQRLAHMRLANFNNEAKFQGAKDNVVSFIGEINNRLASDSISDEEKKYYKEARNMIFTEWHTAPWYWYTADRNITGSKGEGESEYHSIKLWENMEEESLAPLM